MVTNDELIQALKPVLNETAREGLNELLDAMDAMAESEGERCQAAGLRVLLEGDEKRRDLLERLR